jgi:acyl-CoA reductase-like NAD-dependent aldehyde dehydrogenase
MTAPNNLDHSASRVPMSNVIDGQLVATGAEGQFDGIDPFTGGAWSLLPDAGNADVDAAVAAASAANKSGVWAGLPAHERGRVLNRVADGIEAHSSQLARMESLDTGKPLTETSRQVAFAARVYRFFGGFADKNDGRVVSFESNDILDFTVNEPIGVCALLTAWNSPMQLLANKLAPALAAGNTAVVRPSEHASASTAHFAASVLNEQLPAGVVNVVTSRETATAKHLVSRPEIDLVSLTGGVTTGRAVAAEMGAQLTPFVGELGGKSPQVVFADADVDAVIEGIAAGIFAAGGQTCVAGSRLLVEQEIYDEVVSRLVKHAEGIKLGDPLDEGTQMGPMANAQHFSSVSRYIESGVRDGATLLTGGVDAPGNPGGLFVNPTIFADVDQTMAIVQEEIFGPVLVVSAFATDEEAIELANGTSYGLAGGVWTRDGARALAVARRIRAGSVWINTYRQVSPAAPFGGVGQSGIGRERGLEGLMAYTRVKNIMVQLPAADRS